MFCSHLYFCVHCVKIRKASECWLLRTATVYGLSSSTWTTWVMPTLWRSTYQLVWIIVYHRFYYILRTEWQVAFIDFSSVSTLFNKEIFQRAVRCISLAEKMSFQPSSELSTTDGRRFVECISPGRLFQMSGAVT